MQESILLLVCATQWVKNAVQDLNAAQDVAKALIALIMLTVGEPFDINKTY